jgi:hypothetical protein
MAGYVSVIRSGANLPPPALQRSRTPPRRSRGSKCSWRSGRNRSLPVSDIEQLPSRRRANFTLGTERGSFWPRGGSDARQAQHCFYWNDRRRRCYLDRSHCGLSGDGPTPVSQYGPTPGSHNAGARAYATNLDPVRTAPTYAVIHRDAPQKVMGYKCSARKPPLFNQLAGSLAAKCS